MRNFLLLMGALWLSWSLAAQPTVAPKPILDNPYNTVHTHLYYLTPPVYRPDESAKTMYGLQDRDDARELAIQLKQIMEGKGLKVQLGTIPVEPEYLDTITKQNRFVLFPNELPDVYVERIDGKWYYSRHTVAQIPALYKQVYPLGSNLFRNILPSEYRNQKVFGVSAWKWLGIVILLVGGFFLHWLISFLLRRVLNFVMTSRFHLYITDKEITKKIARLLSYLLTFWLIKVTLPSLMLPVGLAHWGLLALSLLNITFFVMLLLAIIDFAMLYFSKVAQQTASSLDNQVAPILRRTLKIAVVILGAINGLQLLEVNVTTLLAGISIGGLAVALAAQDTVRNLIGSFMIFVDKPFQIGDWITSGEVDGTVEEVGFRTTRIRAADSSLYTIPNGRIADTVVNNKGLKLFKKCKIELSINHHTPSLVLEKFIEGLRLIIEHHPGTIKDFQEVYLTNIATNSLSILFHTYLKAQTSNEEHQVKQEILMAILQLAEELGVQFIGGEIPKNKSVDVQELNSRVGRFVTNFRLTYNKANELFGG